VKRDPVILVVVAMLVSLMLVFGFNMARRRGDEAREASSPPMGLMAPDFAMKSLDGKVVHLSDFRGKAVVLNFWATWCDPCREEMPWFVDLQKEYGPQGLQIVGVAMDDADPADIAKFAKELNIDYPILVGAASARDSVADAYGGIDVLPETFYIGRDGKVLQKVFGLKERDEIESYMKQILNQPANQPRVAQVKAGN
jgi:peroxiredoxin